MAETLVMGVLNLTPDSFSDGGDHDDVDAALAHAQRMIAAGAEIIDVGGESTRPGAQPVDPQQEQRRVLAVLERLLDLNVRISLDTRHPSTARAALQLAGELAGKGADALIINDVSGMLTDPDMPAVVAEYGCEVVITHNRGDSATMQQLTEYHDVVSGVVEELTQIRARYLAAGVSAEQIIVDPGIGFAKTHQQNW
ncbi:MAG: dihydropteroate synthase, partial [Nesterenkonia sp.]